MDVLPSRCRTPIVHRDMKSHNVLVAEHWGVKVGDFLLSIQLHGDTVSPTSLCGTLRVPPDGLLHNLYGQRSTSSSLASSCGSSSPAASPTPEGPPTRPTTRES